MRKSQYHIFCFYGRNDLLLHLKVEAVKVVGPG